VLIIIAHNLADQAKEKLSKFGELLELRTEGITYPAISSHPDIFFCQSPGSLIVAPNLPQEYFDRLNAHKIDYITGELPVGGEYPASARYNAVATPKFLIHNFRHTDFGITRALEDLTPVHVDQGYCRCNLLPLRDEHFITSDIGILRGLHPLGLHPLGLHPSGIHLEGFPNGFFGGCCGVLEDIVFINGELRYYREGDKVREYLEGLDYKIIELSDTQLVDVGSILFLNLTGHL
jgi:hypothetical protein